MAEPSENQPHTIGSLRESHPISRSSIEKVEKNLESQKQIAVILARLASHYWRPDFTAMQAEMLFADIIEDVRKFSVHEIETACRSYRQSGANKFFPKPGDLRDLMQAERKHRAHLEKLGDQASLAARFLAANGYPLPSRPLMWWLQRREHWPTHWLESQVPLGEKIKDRGEWRSPEYFLG